jgi:hypothetical protein
MWITQSPWALLALTVPWFFLSFADEDECEFPPDSFNWVLALCAVETLGLIGFGIWLDQSAWPLVTIIWVLLVFAFGAHPPEEKGASSQADEVPATAGDAENTDASPDAQAGLLARVQAMLRTCGKYCAERQPGPTRVVLLVVYVAAFILFFSVEAKTYRPDDGPPFRRYETTIGSPYPWFEHWSQKQVGGETRVNLLTPAWLFVVAAFTALHLLLVVRPKDVPVSPWEFPRTHAVIWLLLALAGVFRTFVVEAFSVPPTPHYFMIAILVAFWLALAIAGFLWARRQRPEQADHSESSPTTLAETEPSA